MIERKWDLLTKEWAAIEQEPEENFLNPRIKQLSPEEEKGQDYQILDNIASGVIVTDLAGKVTIFNRRAEEILRFKAKEFIGGKVELIPSVLANLLLNTLKKGETYHRKEVHILPENILLGVSTSQFYNFRGEVVGAAMVFADLVKIKGAERSRERKKDDDFWQRLAARLAHEIKNPLVSISTLTQLLPKRYDDAQFREEFHSTVSNDIRRLDNFVENLLTLAAPLQLDCKIQNLEKVIKEAINSVWGKDAAPAMTPLPPASPTLGLAERRGGERSEASPLHSEAGAMWPGNHLPSLSFDFHKLKQALRNLLLNAAEAMSETGTLPISVHSVREDFVEIRIQDRGQGIAAENLSQIFLPFFTTKEGHLGLGLAMAKRIIEAHGGFIECRDRAKACPQGNEQGKGSIFSLYLPAKKDGV